MAEDLPSLQTTPQAGLTTPTVFSLMQLLMAELEGGASRGRLYRESVAVAMAIAALGSGKEEERAAAVPPVQRAIDYIWTHLDQDISIVFLARAAGTSVRQLSRGFRSATGLSPYRYLMTQRIERARELLSGTNQPIKTIAMQCGFKTISHFTRAYREITGTTPAAYRGAKICVGYGIPGTTKVRA